MLVTGRSHKGDFRGTGNVRFFDLGVIDINDLCTFSMCIFHYILKI